MRRTHASEPALITTAHESADDQYDRRRRKYAILMTIRGLCVIAAATTYHVSIWLALSFVVGGMVLPWCAVIIANDRPARSKTRRPEFHADLYRERALPPGGSHDDGRTVDG